MANQLVGNMGLRSGSGFARKGDAFDLIFGEEWQFRVKTDTVTTDRTSILYDTPGLPRVGLLYNDLGLVCEELTCEREPLHALYWNVTARFQTGTEKQQSENDDPNPLSWYPVFVVDGFATKERTLTQDFSVVQRKPVNSAGTPFDSPLMTTTTTCQFSFVQFESPVTPLKTIVDRNDKINTSAFLYKGQTFAAKTLLCNVENAELGAYAGFVAWKVKYKLTYDPETHDEKRLDFGPYYWENNEWKVYMDATNTFPIIGPLLNGGKSAGVPPNPGEPGILVFQTKDDISFSFIRTK